MFKSIKSVIFPTANIAADKQFWQTALGVEPYVDQPYYVGFKVNGCELGLDPNAAKEGITIPVAYWNVADTSEAVQQLVANGAAVNTELKDVGGGMMVGTFKDPAGNIFGIIDDPEA